MHTIDLVNLGFSRLKNKGVELRFLHRAGVAGGLCRIAKQHILFMDESSTAAEQLDLVAAAFKQLGTDLNELPAPLRDAVRLR